MEYQTKYKVGDVVFYIDWEVIKQVYEYKEIMQFNAKQYKLDKTK